MNRRTVTAGIAVVLVGLAGLAAGLLVPAGAGAAPTTCDGCAQPSSLAPRTPSWERAAAT